MRVHKILVAFAIWGINGIAFPAETVFGIPLGEPFSIPECTKSVYGYSVGTDRVCFERLFGRAKDTGPIGDETIRIRFPITESPQVVSGGQMIGLVIEGRLEGVGFNTRGLSNQDEVLSALKEKFGEAIIFVPRKVQNRLGASFEAFTAAWNLPNMVVTFQSVSGSIDSGLVNIDTKKGSDHRNRKLKELTKDPRPL